VAAPTPQRFDVLEFRVEGNSVLAAEKIERAVYRFMGEGRTIEDVEEARASLERVYRDGGFGTVAVDIPPQKIVNGVVVLNVVEGRVARLRVVGSRYYSQERIMATVPGLAEGSVPYLPEVQQQLAQVNTSADKRVTPLLRPGKEPGTTEVDLQVEDQLPLHGNVQLNNFQSPNTTASRLVASLRYANLFQREHALGLLMQISPQNTSEVKVFGANYSLPVGRGTLVASAVRSDSSSFVGGNIGVNGQGNIYGLRYLLSLPADAGYPGQFHSLTFGVDYKDVKQDLRLVDSGTIRSPIRYAPFSLSYYGGASDQQGAWDWLGGWTFALRGVASNEQQFADKRFQAKSNFSILKLGLGRTQKLPFDLSLYARIDGQLTGQPLVSNEQYVAGGVETVRGYLESTQSGDSALRGSIELRSGNLSPSERFELLQVRAFLDGAYLRVLSPLPGTSDSYQLASTGAGITLKAPGGVGLSADLAWPLRDSSFQKAYRPRLQASATYEF
jgi:hemolysin activation/secretion protein